MLPITLKYTIGTAVFLSSSALSSLGIQLQALALKTEREWNERTEDMLQEWLEEDPDLQICHEGSLLASQERMSSPTLAGLGHVSPRQLSMLTSPSTPISAATTATDSVSTITIRTLIKIIVGKRLHRRISRFDALRILFRRIQWHVGLALYLLDQSLGSVIALQFIPPILLAPLGGSGLVFNLLFSRLLLGTEIKTKDWIGTGLILAGCTIVSIFAASLPDIEYSMKDLLVVISRPSFITYLSIQLAIVTGMLGMGHLLGMTLAKFRIHVDRIVKSSSALLSVYSSRGHGTELSYTMDATSSSEPREATTSAHSPRNELKISSSSESIEEYYTPNSETQLLLQEDDMEGQIFHSHSSEMMSTTKLKTVEGGPVITVIETSRESVAHSTTSSTVRVSTHHNKLAYLSRMTGILFSMAGGVVASDTLFLAKSGVGELLQILFNRSSQVHEGIAAITLLTILIATIIVQLYSLNQALRYHIPLVVIPIFYTCYSCFAFLSSVMVLDILLHSPLGGGIVTYGSILGGLSSIIAGVWLLGSHHESQVK